jgi:hypothetical protein
MQRWVKRNGFTIVVGKMQFCTIFAEFGDESALNRQKLLNESNFTPSWG